MYEVGKTEENPNANGLALVINKNFTDYVEKKTQEPKTTTTNDDDDNNNNIELVC